jgi:hypothetical protein
MKRNQIALLFAFNLVFQTGFIRAQEETNPVPRPPYLAAVPDYGHWTVKFTYKANAPAAPASGATPAAPAASAPPDGFPTAIDTIKTGDLRGVVLTFANGTSKQYTCQGDWVLTSGAKGPQLGIASSTSRPYIYYTTGFILLDGVKVDPTTFQELAKYNGVPAFHYKSGDVDVWVNPATMLPLAAKQPGVEVSYQFLNPPPKPFPIPDDQASLLKKEQNAYKSSQTLR